MTKQNRQPVEDLTFRRVYKKKGKQQPPFLQPEPLVDSVVFYLVISNLPGIYGVKGERRSMVTAIGGDEAGEKNKPLKQS